MQSVEEARDRILQAVSPLAPIELPLLEAQGCVLAAEVVAEYDAPPFSSAEVDGLAVRAADIHAATSEAPAALRVVGQSPGGRPPDATVGWGEAVLVRAGAPLPAGADCVVPVEGCRVDGDAASVSTPVEEGAFVLQAGRDVKAGEVLIPAGRRLGAPELAVLANVGHAAPLAYPNVRVAVLSVGPGLVEPGRPSGFGQVRESASFAVFGALRDTGAVPYRVGIIPEEPVHAREAVLTNLSRADAFVVTVGAAASDLEPRRFPDLGPIAFSDVAMAPGGRYGLGLVEGRPFFVVPGGPVSAFVAFEVLIRPAILRMMGRRDLQRPGVRALLDEEAGAPEGVTLFAPVRVEHREGAWRATPTGPAGEDLLGMVARANGLMVVPAGEDPAGPGTEVRVRIFRSLER
jgi:molybdopterin molybdotransferase